MVTAEAAVALTALTMVLAALLWVITVVGMQVRCVDSARDVARAMARGESVEASRAEAERGAPDGAQVTVTSADGVVTATVWLDARPDWPVLAAMPAVRVEGTATVALEPGEGEGDDVGGAATGRRTP